MSTKTSDNLRERILAAALDVIRRDGVTSLTQPRVAAAARIRQSHLTYYFPTRRDLVAAVTARLAEGLIAGFSGALGGEKKKPAALAADLARIATPAQTRLLLAFVLAADREPSLRDLFRRLTKAVRKELAAGLARSGLAADAGSVALLHALGVGLAVLDLARSEPGSRREIHMATSRALSGLKPKQRKRA